MRFGYTCGTCGQKAVIDYGEWGTEASAICLCGHRRYRLAEAEVAMGTHRADDGRLQGAEYTPLSRDAFLKQLFAEEAEGCPKCTRAGWALDGWCLGCGYIWPAVAPPIAKTTDPTDTPHAPIDAMKSTVDGWSDALRKEAYKYLFNRYDLRIDKCR